MRKKKPKRSYAWDRLPRRRRFLAAGLSVLLAALIYQIAIGSVEAVAYRYMIPAVAPSLLLAGIVLEALHKDCREHSLPRRLKPVLARAMVFWIHPASNSPGSLFSGIRHAGRSRFHVRLWEFAKQPDWSERW